MRNPQLKTGSTEPVFFQPHIAESLIPQINTMT